MHIVSEKGQGLQLHDAIHYILHKKEILESSVKTLHSECKGQEWNRCLCCVWFFFLFLLSFGLMEFFFFRSNFTCFVGLFDFTVVSLYE